MQRKSKPFWKSSTPFRKITKLINENVIEPIATIIVERVRERNDIFDQSGPCADHCACETCWLGWQLPNRTLLNHRIRHIIDGEVFSISRKFGRIGNVFKRLKYELKNPNRSLKLYVTLTSGEIIMIKVRSRTVGQIRTSRPGKSVTIIYTK